MIPSGLTLGPRTGHFSASGYHVFQAEPTVEQFITDNDDAGEELHRVLEFQQVRVRFNVPILLSQLALQNVMIKRPVSVKLSQLVSRPTNPLGIFFTNRQHQCSGR